MYNWTDGELVTAEKLNNYSAGMEEAKAAAEASAQKAEDAVAHNEYTDYYVVPILIASSDPKEALKSFIEANIEFDDLTNICSRFFKAAAKSVGDKTYTSQFYKFETSNVTTGEKLDDNADLICEPSTNTVAAQDDYAALPLFACFDVDYTIDADTLEPVIHAIKDVYGGFDKAPADSLVGVMQMTGWVRRTSTETTKKVEYRALETAGFEPLPEAVRASDNKVRSFVIHAKYAAGYNSAGLLSSVSGAQSATYRTGSAGSTDCSHNGQISKWRAWGSQYGGSSLIDIAFMQLMFEIKYAVLGSVAKMAGCRNYYYSYATAVAETGVTRILLTASQASVLVVGSSVSLGTASDRSKATCYDVCDIVTIASIEDVTVDEVAYKAVNLNTDTTFDVAAGTYLTTQPWQTGGTDDVLGCDGSPTSNTSGREPFKIQGIETMLGMYEIPGDTTLYEDTEKYTVYLNRKASEIVSNSSGTNPVTAGTIPKVETAGWSYVAELNWDANQEGYMIGQLFGATSSTGYRAAYYRDAAATTGWREWQALGSLSSSGAGGLAFAHLGNWLGNTSWSYGARALGSGGNRGEYAATAV